MLILVAILSGWVGDECLFSAQQGLGGNRSIGSSGYRHIR